MAPCLLGKRLHLIGFMLSIFKKLFGKSESVAIAPVAEPVPQQPTTPMPAVEVAHLALAAIVDRFPEELKTTILRVPDAAATVALPLPTILKQLPGGQRQNVARQPPSPGSGSFPAARTWR